MAYINLIIADTHIKRDDAGRYSLNDLHRAAIASGVIKDVRPSEWLALAKTRESVEALAAQIPGCSPISPSRVRYGGTFVSRVLVHAYAMWISPRFYFQMIRAYDQAVTDPLTADLTDPSTLRALLLSYTEVDRARANGGPAGSSLGAHDRTSTALGHNMESSKYDN